MLYILRPKRDRYSLSSVKSTSDVYLEDLIATDFQCVLIFHQALDADDRPGFETISHGWLKLSGGRVGMDDGRKV